MSVEALETEVPFAARALANSAHGRAQLELAQAAAAGETPPRAGGKPREIQ